MPKVLIQTKNFKKNSKILIDVLYVNKNGKTFLNQRVLPSIKLQKTISFH